LIFWLVSERFVWHQDWLPFWSKHLKMDSWLVGAPLPVRPGTHHVWRSQYQCQQGVVDCYVTCAQDPCENRNSVDGSPWCWQDRLNAGPNFWRHRTDRTALFLEGTSPRPLLKDLMDWLVAGSIWSLIHPPEGGWFGIFLASSWWFGRLSCKC